MTSYLKYPKLAMRR